MVEQTLSVSEVFGPTVQGEGPHAGRACWFIRLGLCNLSCARCDTPYTWDATRFDLAKENPHVSVDAVADRIPEGTLVILTGGEPLMHQKQAAFTHLLKRLAAAGSRVHVETNGTIAPTLETATKVEWFTVSPKVGEFGTDPEKKRVKPDALALFAELAADGRACFKFVCSSVPDVFSVSGLCGAHGIRPEHVWIMPEGTDEQTLLTHHRDMLPAILAEGFNTTTRLHVLLWGNQRGR